MPMDRDKSRAFALTIEFARSPATLRGAIRFRVEPQQLPIQFGDQSFDFREQDQIKGDETENIED
jgi:hypothetical protein